MGFLSKVFSPVGEVLNGVLGGTSAADQSYELQKKLAAQSAANNIALWNLENQYNTPAAQIARLKEAGIDVNPMTYAVGNGNMSTTAGSINAPNYNAPTVGNGVAQALQLIQGIGDVRTQQANIANTEANTAAVEWNTHLARQHGMPVGQVPTIDKVQGDIVNELYHEGKEVGNIIIDSWRKARSNYVKKHPDYKGI